MGNLNEERLEEELSKIVGYDAIKLEIRRICDMMLNPEKYEKLGANLPHGIFIHGDPGVGKTLIANCIMKASGRNLVVCRKNKSDGDFINYINECFKMACQHQPSIILLDDIDKFANEDEKHTNAEEYVTVQAKIDLIKDKDILVIATANDKFLLPDSLIREGRFDEHFEIFVPTGDDSKNIIKYYLGQKKFVDDLDIDEIASLLNGCSCAELETMINRAGMYSGYANKEKIDMEDMVKAILRNKFHAPLSLNEKSEFAKRKIAYHEAGHAVVGELLEKNSVALISILNHVGEVGGITTFYHIDDYWADCKHLENRIMTLLGGKAIIELKYGKTDIGAGDDIERAVKIEKRIVSEYCKYSFNEYVRPYDENPTSNINLCSERVGKELDNKYQKCKEILSQNMDIVENITDELVAKQILTHSDIERIINDTIANRNK